MTASLSDWYDHVLPHVPGVVPAMADAVIRLALIDFCRRSKKWRYDVPAIDSVASTADYTLTPESGAQVAGIIRARYDSDSIDPTTVEELDALQPTWRTDTGVPTKYLLDAAMTSITLVLTPSDAVTGALEVTIAQAPTMSATAVPDWIMNQHHEDITSGALYRLYEMPRKPWTDANLAMYHKARCNAAIGAADMQAAKENTRAPLRTRAYSGVR